MPAVPAVIDGAFNGLVDEPADLIDGGDIIDAVRNGGVRIIHSSVTIDFVPTTFRDTLKAILDHEALFDLEPQRTMRVTTGQQARDALAGDRLGVVYHFQGAGPIEHDIDNLEIVYRLGLRILQLTYNNENLLGSGCMVTEDRGLTHFGRQVVDGCNSLGILVDLSHTGERTSLEAVERSSVPVSVTHSNARALTQNKRNISDTLIKAVAARGGIIGLCPHSVFVEKSRGTRPTLDDFIDHVAHMADLVGAEHLSLATDRFATPNLYSAIIRRRRAAKVGNFHQGYTAEEKHVIGFTGWNDWPNLAEALHRRGFSESEVSGIFHGNLLSLYEKVWR
jgi:membrane dipeptidase